MSDHSLIGVFGRQALLRQLPANGDVERDWARSPFLLAAVTVLLPLRGALPGMQAPQDPPLCIAGGILAGVISDRLKKRASTCGLMLLLAAPTVSLPPPRGTATLLPASKHSPACPPGPGCSVHGSWPQNTLSHTARVCRTPASP